MVWVRALSVMAKAGHTMSTRSSACSVALPAEAYSVRGFTAFVLAYPLRDCSLMVKRVPREFSEL